MNERIELVEKSNHNFCSVKLKWARLSSLLGAMGVALGSFQEFLVGIRFLKSTMNNFLYYRNKSINILYCNAAA